MTSVIEHRQKHRSPPPQPLDRHLSEIGEYNGTVYINAGIDSTCCKKPVRTIHQLTDGIVVSSCTPTIQSKHHDTNEDRCNTMRNTNCCIHCGKRN